jgi:hypothetical protein
MNNRPLSNHGKSNDVSAKKENILSIATYQWRSEFSSPSNGPFAILLRNLVVMFLELFGTWFLLTKATELTPIIIFSSIAGFFLDWTRRGVKQPLVQNVTRPELRATAMALTEFF